MPPAWAKSVSTSARSRSPSSPASARRISTVASALPSDRASTRSTGDSAARIPAFVNRYPIDGSAARIASYAALSREALSREALSSEALAGESREPAPIAGSRQFLQ